MYQNFNPFGWNTGNYFFPANAYRSSNDKQQNPNCTIKVNGTGSVTADPNEAIISVGIITEDEDLKKAQNKNTSISNDVILGLNEIGIDEKDIETVTYSVRPTYDYHEGEKTFRGYEVKHILKITIDDISKVGSVINVATKNGANLISDIAFTISNPEDYYNKALDDALLNAYKKAESMANTLEVNLNETPLWVIENSTALKRNYINLEGVATNGTTPPIQEGEINIVASITVLFAYGCFE